MSYQQPQSVLQPIDTWNDVHVFLTFDYMIKPPVTQHLLSRYDFIWAATNTGHPTVKKETIVSNYFSFLRPAQHDEKWWKANHPDWLLYKQDGTQAYYVDGNKSYLMLDFSNPDVFEWQAQTFCSWLETTGADALAIDNFFLRNYFGAYQVLDAQGMWKLRFGGMVNDPIWFCGAMKWLSDMQNRLRQMKPHRGLIPNVGSIGEFAHLLFNVDGVLDEAGFTDGRNYVSGQDWERKIAFMQLAQSKRLPYYCINQFGDFSFTPKDGEPKYCERTTGVTPQAIQWALASYLMGKEHSSEIFISAIQQYGCAL